MLKSGGKSEKLDKLVNGLGIRGLGDLVAIDVGIVRGLAYYTGIVFEVFDRAGNSVPSPVAAVTTISFSNSVMAQFDAGSRFAMGDVVLGEVIKEIPRAREAMQKAIASDRKIDIYIVIAKEERRADALTQIQQLRDRGYRVDYPLTATKDPKQFEPPKMLGTG